ncbi:MAG: hypothetical protein AAF985_08020 [Bacteroidota bacterium]
MKINLAFKVFLMSLLLGCFSCEIINPEEDIPAYLHIKPFQFSTNPFSEGSASHSITDAWVFVDNVFLGAYKLPATLPVLATGSQEVRVSAGILDNGISALPEIYTMYEEYRTTIDLVANEEDTIQPVTRYQGNLKFLLEPQEDFEAIGLRIGEDLDNNPMTNLVRTDTEVFEGAFSGHIHLTQDQPSIETGSIRFENVPFPIGATVYLEMNYKTDVVVVFGVIAYDALGQRIFAEFDKGINPKDTWNKIYFNFTDEILSFSNSDQVAFYQFCIHSQLDSDQEEGNIYFDNMKWITF